MVAAGFEQKRDVEHNHALAPDPGRRNEAALGITNHGMQDLLEPAQLLRTPEHLGAQHPAIDPTAWCFRRREGGGDRRDGPAARPEQPMNRRIGIEDRHTEPPQHRRGGAFAHPDRARQAEDDHRGASVVTTAARKSRVARTAVLNHASNPGLP